MSGRLHDMPEERQRDEMDMYVVLSERMCGLYSSSEQNTRQRFEGMFEKGTGATGLRTVFLTAKSEQNLIIINLLIDFRGHRRKKNFSFLFGKVIDGTYFSSFCVFSVLYSDFLFFLSLFLSCFYTFSLTLLLSLSLICLIIYLSLSIHL